MADGEIKKILQDLRRNQLDIILRLEVMLDNRPVSRSRLVRFRFCRR